MRVPASCRVSGGQFLLSQLLGLMEPDNDGFGSQCSAVHGAQGTRGLIGSLVGYKSKASALTSFSSHNSGADDMAESAEAGE